MSLHLPFVFLFKNAKPPLKGISEAISTSLPDKLWDQLSWLGATQSEFSVVCVRS